MGNVLQGGVGQAPARQAAIHAGLPGTIPAMTVNKVCGSGLKAVMLGAQAIKAGDEQCVVAGGMEAMSNAPHYVYGMRGGIKVGNTQLVDGIIHDGLWDSFSNTHMGNLAEYTAKKAQVSREDQDRFALASHEKAVAAMEACRFKAETVPVEIPGKQRPTVIDKDEGPRKDTSLEALAALKPSFEKDGSVTPGNAPGLNDGASALVVASLAFARAHGLQPLARITAYATGGGEPKDLFFAPIVAVRPCVAVAAMPWPSAWRCSNARGADRRPVVATARPRRPRRPPRARRVARRGARRGRGSAIRAAPRHPRAPDPAASRCARGGRAARCPARGGEPAPLSRARRGGPPGVHAVRGPA